MDYSLFNLKGRLAQFLSSGKIKNFWEETWGRKLVAEALERARHGRIDECNNLFAKYLPKGQPVLEAGCGMGQLVMALHVLGYNVEGVDTAGETIRKIREAAQELNVREGDIYRMDVPDNYYAAYISIGVLEHNPDGPEAGLKEARRILKPGGTALISVPYLNAARAKKKAKAPKADAVRIGGWEFYQYYFSKEEFSGILKKSGFEIVEIFPYALYSGLSRDYKIGSWLADKKFFFWRLHRLVTKFCRESPLWLRMRCSHMIMFVCRPVK